MREGKKEDLLEAVYLLTQKGSFSTPSSRLTSHLQILPDELETLIVLLIQEGALERDAEGQVRLTSQGIPKAEQVVKKHKTLEHFFIEMLGADPAEASREACRLEHHISDEMVGRLSALVDGSADTTELKFVGQPRPLLDFQEGDVLVIVQIEHPGRINRLMDLGFLPGERIWVKRKLKNRALVVGVKGCDIALSPDIAALIWVEKPR